MLVAVPSDAPGGLDARISDHFGHCDTFTVVAVEDGEAGEVSVLANQEHDHGGCMAPVTFLKEQGVEALVAGGMGQRPLAGFQEVGIRVFSKEGATTVGEAIALYSAGVCSEFQQEQTCGGCGGHDHAPVVREVVDGPVADGQVVRVSFVLEDTEGEEIDSAEGIHYLHGSGQLVPGLEKALTGHTAGDRLEVTVEPDDGFGDRDEERVMHVPLDQLPDGVQVGMTLQASLPNGGVMPLTVASLEETEAVLDANHPLAGVTLVFKVEVLAVLAPTPEDLEHGHVH